MRRLAAALIVALALAFPLLVYAQPTLSLRSGDGLVFVEVGYSGAYNLSVVVRDSAGTTVYANKTMCAYNCTLSFKRPEPGVYYVNVNVEGVNGSWSRTETLVVEPTRDDFSHILARLSRVAATVEEAPYLYSDLKPLVSEARTYYGMALKAFLDGRGDMAAYYYWRCSRRLAYLEAAVSSRGGGGLYAAFSHLEEYLSLSLPVVMDFWAKILLSTFILPLILLAAAPLYISSVEDWIHAVMESLDKRDESIYTAAEETRKRALELLQGASRLVKVKAKTLVMTLMSALIAAIGLITNNTAVVIASMLIAPFMSVVLGAAIGLAMPRREVVVDGERVRGEDIFSEGLRNIVLLTVASLVLVWITVKAASFFVPIFPGSEIMARSRPNFSDLAIAIGAGLACAVSYVGVLEFSGLIGAAIAIALIPPLATIGIGVAIGRVDISLGAFSLFYINTISIILASIFVIKFYIIQPVARYFFSRLERGAESLPEFIVESLQLWVNATFGFTGGWDEKSISNNLKRLFKLLVKFVFFPVAVVAGYALLMSSPIPTLLSQASLSLVETAGRFLAEFSTRVITAISLLAFIAMAYYTYKIVRGRGLFRRRFLASAAVFWLTASLATKIVYFPRSNLVFLTVFAVYVLVVYYWGEVRRQWSHYVILGFTVFTILIISLQSIEVYQVSTAAQKLSSESTVVADAVAIFFGVSPENVTATVVQGKNPRLTVRVYVSVRQLGSLEKAVRAVDILEKTFREYGFERGQVDIVFSLKP